MKLIEDIKQKITKGKTTKGCLVLEGGAFRGIYTAGVLDYFLEHGLNIDTCYGVSAGALTGMNYLAGNYGRSALLILEHRKNHRYVGLDAYRESGSVVGFEFMFKDLEEEYPLNEDRLFAKNKKLNILATNVYTGKPEMFTNHNGRDLMFKAVRASASMPLVSKMVKIDNQLYLDGGCSVKIPIREAINDGNKKIIFVGTRESSYRRKENSKEFELVKRYYKRYPKFVEAFKQTNKHYNEDCDYIDKLVEEKKIMRITPSEPVKISRLEKSIKKLSDLYYLGYSDAEKQFDEIIKYLKK